MVLINIIGDIIAIHYFNSLTAVAVVTIVTVTSGVFVGIAILKKELGIKIKDMFIEAFFFILQGFKKNVQELSDKYVRVLSNMGRLINSSPH